MSVLSKVTGAHFCGPTENSSTSNISNCHLARCYQSLVAFMCYCLSMKIVVAMYSKVVVMRKKINKLKQVIRRNYQQKQQLAMSYCVSVSKRKY